MYSRTGVNWYKLIISSLLLVCVHNAYAQFSVTASSADACQCTGVLNYTPSNLSATYSYQLFDANDALIDQGFNLTGNLNLGGLCPTVFHIAVTEATGISQDHYFNVPAGSTNIGEAHKTNVCLEQYPNIATTYDLTPELSSFNASGIWNTPENYIIPNSDLSSIAIWQVNPANPNETVLSFENGWYTYTESIGGCDVTSGIYIQTNDVGLTTTYVICETYEPFNMTDFLQGTPDTIGQWFDANNNIVPGGIFDPSTMNEALFTYVISNLSGCNPVFRSMYVDEQTQRNAGEDAEVLVCAGSSNFNMLQLLGGTPDDDAPNAVSDGYWIHPGGGNLMPMGNDIFSPSTMVDGIYTYITNSAAPCSTNSATLTITFTSVNPSGIGAVVQLCSSDGPLNMLNALEGNPMPGGTWTNSLGAEVDGTFNPLSEPAGNYAYYYPNVGCTSSGAVLSLSVEAPKNAGNDHTETICQSDANINLGTLLSSNASSGGIWTLGSNAVSNIYDPLNAGVFNFEYTVQGIECPDDAANITVYVQPSVAEPISQSVFLCSLQDPVNLTDYFPSLADVYFEDFSGALISSAFDPALQSTTTINVINPSGNACPDQEGQLTVHVVYPAIQNGTTTIEVCRSSDFYNLNSALPISSVGLGSWADVNGNPIVNLVSTNFIGTQTYYYDVIQQIQCGGNHLQIDLVSFTPNDAGADEAEIFCYTDGPELLSTLLPVSATSQGQWFYNGAAFNSALFDPGNNLSGNYIFRIPDNGPCPADEANLQLTVQQGINYTAGNDVHVCAGSPFQSIGFPSSIGTSYVWTPASGLSNPNSAQPTVDIPASVLQTSTVTYSVFADDGVCTLTDYVDVTTEPNPIVNLQESYAICFGEFLTLTNPSEATYQWTPVNLFDNPNTPNTTIQPSASVYIGVEATSDFGCTTLAQSRVVVNPLPILVLDPAPVTGCPPFDFNLSPDTASANIDQIVWNVAGLGTFITDTLSVVLTQPGNYDIHATAISADNCNSTYFFEEIAEVFPRPVASFTSTPYELSTLDPEAEFFNHSVGALNYTWQFDTYGVSEESNPIFSFPNEASDNFRVCLTAENQFGCMDTTCRNIYMNAEYAIFAPNAFTPNNDGDNDVWKPILRGYSADGYDLTIFNRWGEAVFQSNDSNLPWTGEIRNGDYFGTNEVYNWQLQLRQELSAKEIVFKGSVLLMR